MSATLSQPGLSQLRTAMGKLEIALPASGGDLGQDQEYVVVNLPDGWKKIRLHDYDEVFQVPGLYERWVYDILGCQSPAVVASLLKRCLEEAGVKPDTLTVLDLGAGNGYVADEFRKFGVKRAVGVDIHPEAAMAAERDRPGLYADYVVGDLTNLPRDQADVLDSHAFNAMACVAALGFGDIPPEVFAEAYNRVDVGGWIAFTIKTDFTNGKDDSGFAGLIRSMLADKSLELARRETFTHRRSTDGQPLLYDAFIGRKRADIKVPKG
ncbi:MAG: methyltransferase domain-containing protein [Phycisphaerales bacterium]